MANVTRLKPLIELGISLGVEATPWFLSTIEKLSIRWNEPLYKKTLNTLMYNNLTPLLHTTFPVPMSPDDIQAVDEQYKIGRIEHTNLEFGLSPLQLQMHAIVGGGSGYGKSTLIKILCQQILAEGDIKVWMIDPKEGGDYRFLAQQYQDMLILRPHVMRCNPLQSIVNVTRDALRETFADVTADSFGVYDASEGLLTKHAQLVLEHYDSPCLLDLMTSLQTEKPKFGGRMRGYLDSLETRLSKVKTSLSGIIDCRHDYFSELFEQNVVFEVGELSGAAQRFLVPWIIMKLVLYKIKNPSRTISHLLVFDEAQSQIWAKHLENRDRQSYMATLATQCRAFGLGIIVLAQNPALKLMSQIIANSCVKICLHLGSGREIAEMGRHMGLTFEQQQTLYRLERGQAICRTGLGYMEPVMLEIFPFEDQPVSNEQLTVLMKQRWEALLSNVVPAAVAPTPEALPSQGKTSHPTVSRNTGHNRPKRTLGASEQQSQTSSEAVHKKEVTGKPAQHHTDISPEEEQYLRMLESHPWQIVTENYERLTDEKLMGTQRITKNKAVNARQKLLKKKVIESFAVKGTGRSGRPQCDIIVNQAFGRKPHKPRGDLLHAFWCYRISGFFSQQGATVKVGDTLSGNECDIDVTLAGKRLGVEVVITTLVLENIEKQISSGYHGEVLILAIDAKKCKDVEKRLHELRPDVRERVSVKLLKEYFITQPS